MSKGGPKTMNSKQTLNLNIYRNLIDDEIVEKMFTLYQISLKTNRDLIDQPFNKREVRELLHEITYKLLDYYVNSNIDLKDAWQDYLLNQILINENPFSRLIQTTPLDKIGQSYLTGLKMDLSKLQQAFKLNWAKLVGSLSRLGLIEQEDIVTCWQQVGDTKYTPSNDYLIARKKLKLAFLTASNWGDLIEELAAFYRTYGTGVLGLYWAFRLDFTIKHPLIGIAHHDPIKLEQLVGYDSIKKQIYENTDKFVTGLPANNILLYGDRGTGKSSMVKALLNEFGAKGLRLIELTKSQLPQLTNLTAILKGYPQKFIICIDDLSFEENETGYKDLKTLLEGSLEVRPANILIYATSNRRHLIREHFTDRKEFTSDELRSSDTVQEKLSLSDRFGITLVFPSPSKEEYLDIVKSLAEERNLELEESELVRLALQWELWHNGRSGRTAKQFIDYLEGDYLYRISKS